MCLLLNRNTSFKYINDICNWHDVVHDNKGAFEDFSFTLSVLLDIMDSLSNIPTSPERIHASETVYHLYRKYST